MTALLVLLEGGSILAMAAGALLAWRSPALTRGDILATLAQAAVLSVAFLTAFNYADLYNLQIVRSFDALLGRIPRVLATAAALVTVVSLAVPSARIMADPFESSALIAIAVIFGPFLPLRALVYWFMRNRRFGERLLIVGASPLVRTIIAESDWRPDLRYSVVGVVDDGENLEGVIGTTHPTCIVVAPTERGKRFPLYRLVESLAHGIKVEDVAETYERLTGKLALEVLSPSSVLFTRDFRTPRLRRVTARALSLSAAAIGLLVFAPVLGLIAFLLKRESQGPVFFIQERVGLSGRVFKLIKFCTMRPVSQPKSEWEQDNRDRITPLGRWLRRFRLDELPQLVNVLRGDMNLVGPRPHPVSNLEVMVLAARNLSEISGDAIPYYSLRCSVKPGMTGWAQVRYVYANSLEEEMEKIRYDLYYIKHSSLWFDLRILLETLKMVVTRSETTPVARPDEADRSELDVWEPRVRASNGERVVALSAIRASELSQGTGPADVLAPWGEPMGPEQGATR
ncbi:MAG TPA: exopolysaccharide biosynthesis polyprenyl glycosylphosphotransferase [bacterium]|nr:exopolysaccharide biosynthesis polyprenyl glycosylphosphotransferase [bacterium]